jgi:hypothetical protein
MDWNKFQSIVYNGTLSAKDMPMFTKANYPDAAAANDFSHLWYSKNCPSTAHHQGAICQTCHVMGGDAKAIAKGGIFTLAGTLYNNGTASQVGVEGDRIRLFVKNSSTIAVSLITDKNGNFYTTQPLDFNALSMPEVKSTHRSMGVRAFTGQCNGCHHDNPSGRVTP